MWGEFKHILLHATGFGPNDLHVLLGLAIYAVPGLLLRRPVLPLGLLALVQLANEVIDIAEDMARHVAPDWSAFLSDTAVTLAAPATIALTVLVVTRRRRPRARWLVESMRMPAR